MVAENENFSFKAVPVDVKTYLSEHQESLLKRSLSKFKYWFPFTIEMDISYNRPRSKKEFSKMKDVRLILP